MLVIIPDVFRRHLTTSFLLFIHAIWSGVPLVNKKNYLNTWKTLILQKIDEAL